VNAAGTLKKFNAYFKSYDSEEEIKTKQKISLM
jgi:hypothetical protein